MRKIEYGEDGFMDVLARLIADARAFSFPLVGSVPATLIWLDESDQIIAYAAMSDAYGIDTFEVRSNARGQGIGHSIITELRAERPRLYVAGWFHSQRAAKFWRDLGF